MNKQNIVFFMVDQLSAKWLEQALGGVCPLPNVQWLKERGVSFDRVFSSNPVCCPARATIATGLSSRGHGVLENGYRLEEDQDNFIKRLRDAGWETAAFGKVHFMPHFSGFYPDYKEYGFNEYHITEDGRGGEWLDWVMAEHPEHVDKVFATIWATGIPAFKEYGPESVDLAERINQARQKHSWPTDEFPLNSFGAAALPFPAELSQTEWITAHALDYLNRLPGDQPFFIHVSYVQPHSPFHVPGKYLERVNADLIPEPLPAEWVEDPSAPVTLKEATPNIPDEWRFARQCYFADLVHLDEQLGKILAALDERQCLDDTTIFFLTDHGEMCFDHGLTGKAEKHYDACIRIPLIIAGNAVKANTVRDEFVQLEDICPTVLELCDLPLPQMPVAGPYLQNDSRSVCALAGRSLLPLCRAEEAADWRRVAYCESYNNITSNQPSQWARTVRTERYRYTYYPCDGGSQLFDLDKDPDEQHNCVADAAYQTVVQELRGILLDEVILQDCPKPQRNLYALGVH